MFAWLIGLPLIAGAAALAPLAARRWRRGVVALTMIGVLLLAGAVVLLLVAAAAGRRAPRPLRRRPVPAGRAGARGP